jgi:dolichol-phosphate hexosyltransferase
VRPPRRASFIPVYNEGATIGQILGRVLYQPCVQQVVVVDDCSTDETVSAVDTDDPRVILKRHAKNAGKGAAIRTGLAAIRAPIVIIQDADLEYDPVDSGSLSAPRSRAAPMSSASAASPGRPPIPTGL